jgi:tetratricopeptide (TPR) repeat protein
VRQELDFEVRSSYFSRWTDDPLWVLNIGGAGVLVYEEVSYGRNTSPAAISFHFGEPFEFFPNVTHPFKDLPGSIRMKEGETRVLTHLDLVKDGEAVYEYLKKEGKAGEALRLAETYLRAHPGDVSMVDSYATDASRQKQTDRLDQYLKTGLTNRPVRIEWHRWHQRLHQNPKDQAQLIAEYSAMVEADPTNSALLYLRGRIDPDRPASRQLFQRAAAADPSNAYAFFALGYDRMAAGDWPAARKHLARAVELSPADPGFSSTLFEVRLALGETAEIEKELREHLKQKPLDFTAELQLIHAVVAQGRREDALKEDAAYEKRWPAKYAASGRNAITTLRRQTLYAIGDFAELEKSAVSDSSRPGRQILAEAFIEQGRVSEAVKLRTETDSLEEKPFWLLSLAVAFHHAGDTNAAAEWRGKAIEAMAAGNEDYAQAAKMMSAAVPPASADLEAIVLTPSAKALFLSALAQKHPAAATELAAAARHFNIERSFPYHLVERVTADRRGPAEHP